MTARPDTEKAVSPQPLPGYRSILLAVDSSDHSNRGTLDAVSMARLWDAHLTGTHVYAAQLHDVRFRQMEGGLPEQFREEQELERQRDVHDDLIGRGLNIITDSYLDQTERISSEHGLKFSRRSLEGKNYRELVREANNGDYDLLVMGSLGLGAIAGSRLGTVSQRVARRSDIDLLVIKEPQRDLSHGPIVVAVDGSSRAYGGLLTGLSLAQHWQVPLHVISAFDPYYHYVAFNRIAGVLSEEAGKVFRFKEQEKLHEEIIDSGLAKIYQGHLDVALSIADEYGIEITTALLDGKAHDAVEKYLSKVTPSLLILGKLGIHADDELDIGGNAELLLHNSKCAVLLSQREHQPNIELIAETTTSWTVEAEQRMHKVPSFVQNMARMAILRYAQEQGHTVITAGIVDEATAKLMPSHAETAMQEIVDAYDAGELGNKKEARQAFEPQWTTQAESLLQSVADSSLRENLQRRAEKKARADKSATVQSHHIAGFIEAKPAATEPKLHWQAAALARLTRVPEGFMRDSSKSRVEQYARDNGHTEISLKITEQGLAEARKAMAAQMSQPPTTAADKISTNNPGKCPFADLGTASPGKPEQLSEDVHEKDDSEVFNMDWQKEAIAGLKRVPKGFCRGMTIKAAESIANQNGLTEIGEEFFEQVLNTFKSGAEALSESLPWDPDARIRISRAPDMVRGMLVQEIEGWARRQGQDCVDEHAVEAVKAEWRNSGFFHLDPMDKRNT